MTDQIENGTGVEPALIKLNPEDHAQALIELPHLREAVVKQVGGEGFVHVEDSEREEWTLSERPAPKDFPGMPADTNLTLVKVTADRAIHASGDDVRTSAYGISPTEGLVLVQLHTAQGKKMNDVQPPQEIGVGEIQRLTPLIRDARVVQFSRHS